MSLNSVRPTLKFPLKLVRLSLLIEVEDTREVREIVKDMAALRDRIGRKLQPGYCMVAGVGGCSVSIVRSEAEFKWQASRWFRQDGGPL